MSANGLAEFYLPSLQLTLHAWTAAIRSQADTFLLGA